MLEESSLTETASAVLDLNEARNAATKNCEWVVRGMVGRSDSSTNSRVDGRVSEMQVPSTQQMSFLQF